jgi:putative ribosome biogenesis GTPase RsgA
MLEEAHGHLFQSHSKLSDLWNQTQPDYNDFTLKNVVSVCKEVFKTSQVEEANDKEIVVALGNPGCGKSTMFTSLVYGA